MPSTTPKPVENLAVWRAAQDIIKRYPQEPELAACQIADDALATGNLWEFKLWQQVAAVVQMLSRTATGRNDTIY